MLADALLAWLLKSLAILTVTALGARLMRRAPAARRHALWLGAIAWCALLPLLAPSGPAPALTLELPAERILSVPMAATLPRAGVDWRAWLVGIWLSGATGLLLRLLFSHWRLARLLVGAERVLEAGVPARVLVHRAVVVPFSSGVLRSVIVVPPTFAAAPAHVRQCVLLHELAHIARRDCLTQLLAETFLACCWLNPLAWLAVKRMAIERELASDARVIAAGVRPTAYADVLLGLAASTGPHGGPPAWTAAMAEASTLAVRVEAAVAAGAPLGLAPSALVFIALSAIAAACSRTTTPADARIPSVSGAVADATLSSTLPGNARASAPLGRLDPSHIRDVFRAHRDDFRSCYEDELEQDPRLDIKVYVHVTVGADGRPREVSVDPLAEAPALGPCLMSVTSNMVFDPPAGGGDVIINYPFVFRPEPPSEAETEVKRRLDRNDVLPVVKTVAPAVRACVIGDLPTGGGRVVFRWRIEPDGSVTHVELAEQCALPDPDVACARAVLEGMRFPPFSEGAAVPVTFPFMVTPPTAP